MATRQEHRTVTRSMGRGLACIGAAVSMIAAMPSPYPSKWPARAATFGTSSCAIVDPVEATTTCSATSTTPALSTPAFSTPRSPPGCIERRPGREPRRGLDLDGGRRPACRFLAEVAFPETAHRWACVWAAARPQLRAVSSSACSAKQPTAASAVGHFVHVSYRRRDAPAEPDPGGRCGTSLPPWSGPHRLGPGGR